MLFGNINHFAVRVVLPCGAARLGSCQQRVAVDVIGIVDIGTRIAQKEEDSEETIRIVGELEVCWLLVQKSLGLFKKGSRFSLLVLVPLWLFKDSAPPVYTIGLNTHLQMATNPFRLTISRCDNRFNRSG